MGAASVLGRFVHRTSYNDLPGNAVSLAKERILDFLGTAFDSYRRYPMTSVIRVLQAYQGREEATVIGEGIKLPCALAAMVNSAYNISDGSRFTGAHPACVVVPAVLAAAEVRGATEPVSGKDLILAVVLGYEVMLRIGRAMYPSSHNRGFSPTTIHGPMGAAAAVGKILNFDEESIIQAISIASLMGHGLQAADRAPYPTFSFQTGRAAEAGVLCALVAKGGLKGSDEILEEGFYPAFSDEYHLGLIAKDLGNEYAITKTYIKLHGGCRHMHAPIDAALYLRKTHNLNWEDIEQVNVKTYSTALAVCNIKEPQTGRQAEYTIQFSVPVALIYGDASPDRFTDSILRDERVQGLMRKMKVELEPSLDKDYPAKRTAIVEIATKGGKRFTHRLDFAKGEPENPLSPSKLEAKFHFMSSGVLNEETRRQMIALLNRLETIDDIGDLFPLLKAPAKRPA
jgi:2-methylcitrate dehydratase PrpD